MDCQSVQCKVETAIDSGALPDLSADEETHIRSCAQCSTVALLVQAGLPECAAESKATAPADLADSVMARIAANAPGPRAVATQETSESASSSGIIKFLIPLAAAALLVLVVRPFMNTKSLERTPQSVAMQKAEMEAPGESKMSERNARATISNQTEARMADEATLEESKDAAKGESAPAEFAKEKQAALPGGPPAIRKDQSKARLGDITTEGDKLADEDADAVAGGEPSRPDKSAPDVNRLVLLQSELPKKAEKTLTADSVADAKDQVTLTAAAEITLTKSVRPTPAPAAPEPDFAPADAIPQALELTKKIAKPLGKKRKASLAKPKADQDFKKDQEIERPEEESIVVVESPVLEKKSRGRSVETKGEEQKQAGGGRALIRSKEERRPGKPKPTATTDREEVMDQSLHFPSFIQKRFPNAQRATKDGSLILSFPLSPTNSNALAPTAEAKGEKEEEKKAAMSPMFVVSVSFIPDETAARRQAKEGKEKAEVRSKKKAAGKPAEALQMNASTTRPDVVTVQTARGVFYLSLTHQPAGSGSILKDLIEHLRSYR
jgi:hypothetical protein